ncbi:unnamed protein product [Adineta steineri]|uniref:Uncharacterized protein n=1 Tax=Adineta steineri TaxID=433720 RepID=A0A815U3B1_9BILA|nr:unnamed protein product [Adineta steineri]CAF1514117.1 unnamed protein product [Adineta steineri]
MSVVPIHPDTVTIHMVKTSCCKPEFDSDYPTRLNGIIRQDEFEESIANINETISSIPNIIVTFILLIFAIGGFIIFVFSGIEASNPKIHGYALLGAGIGIFLVGVLSAIFGCCIAGLTLSHRMRPAVANESNKYCTRSPTPCTWRLVSKIACRGRHGQGRITVIRHIVIDIGHFVGIANKSVPPQYNQPTPSFSQYNQPTSFFSQKKNTTPPPQYSSLSVRG